MRRHDHGGFLCALRFLCLNVNLASLLAFLKFFQDQLGLTLFQQALHHGRNPLGLQNQETMLALEPDFRLFGRPGDELLAIFGFREVVTRFFHLALVVGFDPEFIWLLRLGLKGLYV